MFLLFFRRNIFADAAATGTVSAASTSAKPAKFMPDNKEYRNRNYGDDDNIYHMRLRFSALSKSIDVDNVCLIFKNAYLF